MKNNFLEKNVPPGVDLKLEKKIFKRGCILSAIYTLFTPLSFFVLRNDLLNYGGAETVSSGEEKMPPFTAIMSDAATLIGFILMTVYSLVLIIYHYHYYRQGSMSVYLMKRLPDRFEMHRRALTVPLIFAITSILLAFTFTVLYFAIYMLITPEQYLPYDGIENLWR